MCWRSQVISSLLGLLCDRLREEPGDSITASFLNATGKGQGHSGLFLGRCYSRLAISSFGPFFYYYFHLGTGLIWVPHHTDLRWWERGHTFYLRKHTWTHFLLYVEWYATSSTDCNMPVAKYHSITLTRVVDKNSKLYKETKHLSVVKYIFITVKTFLYKKYRNS